MRFTAEGKTLVKDSLARLNHLPPMAFESEGDWREFKKEIYGLDCTVLIDRLRKQVQMLIEGEVWDKGYPKSDDDEDEAEDWFFTFAEAGGMKTLVTVTDPSLSKMFLEKNPEFAKYVETGDEGSG